MDRGRPDFNAIFTEALKCPAGPERETYLVTACSGDAAMLRRVVGLLAAHAQASDVPGTSATPAAADTAEAPTLGDDRTGTFDPTRLTDLPGPAATVACTSRPGVGATIDHDQTEPGTMAVLDAVVAASRVPLGVLVGQDRA